MEHDDHKPGHDDHKPKPEHHITLTVITVDGNYPDDYNVHSSLQVVVDKTVDKLHLLYDLSQYDLCRGENTTPLNLSLSIQEAGLLDNDELQLRKRNAGGGVRV